MRFSPRPTSPSHNDGTSRPIVLVLWSRRYPPPDPRSSVASTSGRVRLDSITITIKKYIYYLILRATFVPWRFAVRSSGPFRRERADASLWTASWERLLFFPFPVTFSPSKVDTSVGSFFFFFFTTFFYGFYDDFPGPFPSFRFPFETATIFSRVYPRGRHRPRSPAAAAYEKRRFGTTTYDVWPLNDRTHCSLPDVLSLETFY